MRWYSRWRRGSAVASDLRRCGAARVRTPGAPSPVSRLRRERASIKAPVDVSDKGQSVEGARPCRVAADVGTVSPGGFR